MQRMRARAQLLDPSLSLQHAAANCSLLLQPVKISGGFPSLQSNRFMLTLELRSGGQLRSMFVASLCHGATSKPAEQTITDRPSSLPQNSIYLRVKPAFRLHCRPLSVNQCREVCCFHLPPGSSAPLTIYPVAREM